MVCLNKSHTSIWQTTSTFLFLCLLTIFSCTEESDPSCMNSNFPGAWTWTKSVGGVGSAYITPENSGYTLKIEIGDSTWREFKNDSLVRESLYTIHYDSIGAPYRGWLSFDNQQSKGFSFVGCSLILSGVFEDSLDSYYERK